MNRTQRLAVFFLLFTTGTGAISAPVHDAHLLAGAFAGLVVYVIGGVLALGVEWTLDGVGGVKRRLDELSGLQGARR